MVLSLVIVSVGFATKKLWITVYNVTSDPKHTQERKSVLNDY